MLLKSELKIINENIIDEKDSQNHATFSEESKTKELITLSSADEVVAANTIGILPKMKNEILKQVTCSV